MFDATSDLSALPTPSDAALEQSARVVQSMVSAIEASSSPFTLGQFVHQALYAPGLGYYAAGTRKFGESGDFVTAPELGAVFAQCIARGMARVFDELGPADDKHVLELGAGSGQFAYDCLLELHRLNATPSRYCILEVSPDLRERQADLLATLPHELGERVVWLDRAPDTPFEGVVFANEVVDALPMERFGVTADGRVMMEAVACADGALCSTPVPANAAITEAVARLQAELEPWSTPYVGELRTGVPDWLQSITAPLTRGAVLLVDYGADRSELYRADRTQGTLLCHYRHRAHDHVLLWPGLQDITCWVDFSALAQAGVDLGFTLNGYVSQAHLLIDLGLDEVVSTRFEHASATHQVRLSSEVRQLTLPGEMGERFKALSLSRGLSRGLLSRAHTGLDHRL